MLRNILIVARRDYIESIRTKAFLFGLIVAPILFGSGFIGLALMKSKPDISERRIALIDRTGVAADIVVRTVQERNAKELFNKTGGVQVMPRYQIEVIAPNDTHPDEQRLALSRRVQQHDLYAFVEIGSKAVHPDSAGDKNPDNRVSWYSNEGGVQSGSGWISDPMNDGIRRVRLAQAGVNPALFSYLLSDTSLQTMNLVKKDEKTGLIQPAVKRDEAAVLVPLVLVMMIFMIAMITSAPMLNAIAEDKLQRVHEMLLASATPFDLIAGKVLSAIGRSLTSSILYISVAVLALNAMAMMGVAPFGLIPWFIVYMVAEITMLCAIAAALGSACGSPQDAQSLGMVMFAPVMIPLMLISLVMQKPNGGFATALSFIPPFTPMIMLMRQGMPGGVPAWQPLLGLVGMTAGVIAICWVAARIFRIGLLLQGKPPKLSELARWAVRG